MRMPRPRNSGGTRRVGGDVEAGLDRQHHPGRKRARRAALRVKAHVVHIQAQPVAGAVHVERLYAFASTSAGTSPVSRPSATMWRGQLLDHLLVDRVERRARLDRLDRGDCVSSTASYRRRCAGEKRAADRRRPRHVGGVAVDLAAGVDQQELARAPAARGSRRSGGWSRWRRRRRSWGSRARCRRSCGTCSRSAPRSRARAAAAAAQHRGDVRLRGDLGGAALDRDLVRRLDQTHLVQRRARVDQPHAARADAAALGHAQSARAARATARPAPARARGKWMSSAPPRSSASFRPSSATANAASAPNSRTAPSTPARRPVQVSSAGSRGRTNSTKRIVSWPGRSTTTVPGSSNPVRYRMSLSCLNLKCVSPLRRCSGGDASSSAAARTELAHQLGATLA